MVQLVTKLFIIDLIKFNIKNPTLFFYEDKCYKTRADEALEVIQARMDNNPNPTIQLAVRELK